VSAGKWKVLEEIEKITGGSWSDIATASNEFLVV
jgi:hypothetical protein